MRQRRRRDGCNAGVDDGGAGDRTAATPAEDGKEAGAEDCGAVGVEGGVTRTMRSDDGTQRSPSESLLGCPDVG